RFFFVVPGEDNQSCLLDGLRPECRGSLPALAPIVASGSTPSDPPNGDTVLAPAAPRPSEASDQDARYAVPLCDSCGTAIARSVVAISQGHDPASHLGLASISEPKRQTLIQSLALLAASQPSTATTPTTQSLSLWWGYVAAAIGGITNSASAGPSTASAPLRFLYQSKADREERDRG